jgi:membrane protease YdiL (CAAX protease family)
MMIRPWALVGVVLVIGALSGDSWHDIGLPTSSLFRFNAELTIFYLFIFVLAFWVGLVRLNRSGAKPKARSGALLRGAVALLPHSSIERKTFIGVALTAGICEEILYRGFGIYFVHWAFPNLSLAVPVVLTSIAFGAAHAYQGWIGVIATTTAGLFFGLLLALTGTLFVPMIIHALMDLRLIALPNSLLELLDSQATSGDAAPPQE